MDIHMLITFTTKPEKRSAFAVLLATVRRDLVQAPGCKGVRLFHHRSTPLIFTLLETWESESSHRAHVDRLVRSGTWAYIASHLESEPVSSYCSEQH